MVTEPFHSHLKYSVSILYDFAVQYCTEAALVAVPHLLSYTQLLHRVSLLTNEKSIGMSKITVLYVT